MPLSPARDYKRLKDNNEGPNTGGMGAYCPVVLTQDQNMELQEYVNTLEKALKNENADFTGIVYSGLMLTNKGIKVLEYNMRFGDPETQPLMMHLNTDLLNVFREAANKNLHSIKLDWKEDLSLCVVISADGYPENPKKGGIIANINEIQQNYGVTIFYAGVKEIDGKLTANGGRVLSICKTGKNPCNDIYAAARELEFNDKFYRNDIGAKLCKSL